MSVADWIAFAGLELTAIAGAVATAWKIGRWFGEVKVRLEAIEGRLHALEKDSVWKFEGGKIRRV